VLRFQGQPKTKETGGVLLTKNTKCALGRGVLAGRSPDTTGVGGQSWPEEDRPRHDGYPQALARPRQAEGAVMSLHQR
jgi:hypothetical protein